MKKTGIAALFLLLILLVGCGQKSYKDGTYTGKSGADDLGAYGEVTIEILKDQIISCSYVTWQSDGSIKDEEYGKINGEISNKDFYEKAQLAVDAMKKYAAQLPSVQSPNKVDAVTGATNSYDQFQEAVAEALSSAKG
jgi:major membrane immunogen (membrane-anchored lipoprotein)